MTSFTFVHGHHHPDACHPDRDYCDDCNAFFERALIKETQDAADLARRDAEGSADTSINHGTRTGYAAHLRRGTSCPECRAANARHAKRMREMRK